MSYVWVDINARRWGLAASKQENTERTAVTVA